MARFDITRGAIGALFLSTSAVALATPVLAQSGGGTLLFERGTGAEGVRQYVLPNGGRLSFVGSGSYAIDPDGVVTVDAASFTYAGADTVLALPDGRRLRAFEGSGIVVTLRGDGTIEARSLNGRVGYYQRSDWQVFAAGQAFRVSADGSASRVFGNAPVAAPVVADQTAGGPVAVAANGAPVLLGEALAAAGASGDILAAAQRIDGYVANPVVGTFPTGDLALLIQYVARLEGAFGGTPFAGAQADVIRTYLGYLATGASGADFLSAYAVITVEFLGLLRAGALPSAFDGAQLADLRAFLALQQRTGALAGLAASDRTLVEAYLAFLQGGGSPDAFLASYTDLIGAYLEFLRGGGLPADFAQASQDVIAAYIAFLDQAGLAAQLGDANQALLAALAANGADFIARYTISLGEFYAFLAAGNLPSDYSGEDLAVLRTYLQTLAASGILESALGANASFFTAYLAFLEQGGQADQFAGLPVFADYTAALEAFYAFLTDGNLPSQYGALTEAQVQAYLEALLAAGLLDANFNAEIAAFFTDYLACLQDGGSGDQFAGLPGRSGDGGSPAPNPTPVPGPSSPDYAYKGGFVENTQVRTFAGFQGYRNGADVDIDDDGALISAGTNIVAGNTYIARGSAQSAEVYGDEYALIGRFTDGEAVLNFSPFAIPVNGGLHWASVQPITGDLPSGGTIKYDLLAATSPTFTDGRTAPGRFDGEITVGFGTEDGLGLMGTITMPEANGDVTYAFETEGYSNGQLEPRSSIGGSFTSGISYNAPMTGTGEACAAGTISCSFTFYLVGAGPEMNRLAMDYATQQSTLRGSRIEQGIAVTGAALFGAPGTYTPPTSGGGGQPTGYLPGRSVVYAGKDVGLDARGEAEVAYAADGSPMAHVWVRNDFTREQERPERGGASVADVGTAFDGEISWGRWFDGTTGGNYYGNTFDLGVNDGFHIVAVTRATDLPTSGTINYSLAGATAPTAGSQSVAPGSFSGTLAINFGASTTADFAFEVAIDGGSYAFGANGRPVETSGDFFGEFGGNALAVSGTGSMCPTGTCEANVRGMIGGLGARVAGISYNFGETGGDRVYGAAAFTAPGQATSALADQRTRIDLSRFDRVDLGGGTIDAGGAGALTLENARASLGDWISFDRR